MRQSRQLQASHSVINSSFSTPILHKARPIDHDQSQAHHTTHLNFLATILRGKPLNNGDCKPYLEIHEDQCFIVGF